MGKFQSYWVVNTTTLRRVGQINIQAAMQDLHAESKFSLKNWQ